MSKNTLHVGAMIVFLSTLAVGSAFCDSIVVFGTGQDASGSALPVGQVDPHYSLISAPAGVPPAATTTLPNGLWATNTVSADWISPGSSGDSSWPVGTYDYQTTFSLAGLDASTAQLTGQWASDNNACIFLNGNNTGSCTSFAGFGSLQPFSVTSGFLSGTNTLDFIVTNGGGPTGVIAEVTGTASPVSGVPEPSSLLLLGSTLLALAGASRRFGNLR